jgi:hypothetical protein
MLAHCPAPAFETAAGPTRPEIRRATLSQPRSARRDGSRRGTSRRAGGTSSTVPSTDPNPRDRFLARWASEPTSSPFALASASVCSGAVVSRTTPPRRSMRPVASRAALMTRGPMVARRVRTRRTNTRRPPARESCRSVLIAKGHRENAGNSAGADFDPSKSGERSPRRAACPSPYLLASRFLRDGNHHTGREVVSVRTRPRRVNPGELHRVAAGVAQRPIRESACFIEQ